MKTENPTLYIIGGANGVGKTINKNYMENEIVFREVDAGFHMGFIEPMETILNEKMAGKYEIPSMSEPYEERFCICDPVESFYEIPSGQFDTYILLYKEPSEMKFLGSFKKLDQAVLYLTELYNKGVTFSTVSAIESEYYNSDYSEKKQSIFI